MKIVTGKGRGEIEQSLPPELSLSRLRDFLLRDYGVQVQLERARCDLILNIGMKGLFCTVSFFLLLEILEICLSFESSFRTGCQRNKNIVCLYFKYNHSTIVLAC